MGAIHLIRHGQASWEAEDYDQLSERGIRQSALLGMAWEAADWAPTAAVAGSLKRHAQTAVAAIDASGRGDGYDVDAGWDEYDHRSLADTLTVDRLSMTPREFQPVLESSLARWMDGSLPEADLAYTDWHGSVVGSFERVLEAAGSGQHVAVFTSGGPIATVVSHLLAGDDSLFIRLNAVVVNASVTTVINGSTGPRVLSFNEHAHLPRDLVTFR
ncbi:MAG: histidine phosphatase family protein [Aeromicrobium sp.]